LWLIAWLIRNLNLTAFRFNLPPLKSPTYYNLYHHLLKQGWRPTRYNWLAQITKKHFEFPKAPAESLEFKNILARLITQYCPEVMPTTYCINDNNWQIVAQQLLKLSNQSTWILKPALLNNGQHIKIFNHLEQLQQHYLSNNRIGGEHVLQTYLSPHLLQGPQLGHKYSIRMFVILTNYAGAYLYPQGYFNVALQPYRTNDFSDLRSHLTNEHLNDNERNIIQIPTQQYDLFKPFYPKIKTIISSVIASLKKMHSSVFVQDKPRQLAIFGFDFMVDADERVWLLEANHGPCFPINDEHSLQKNLYYEFWHTFITSFINPIANHQPIDDIQYQLFEKV
jgi:hypothetical protein